jgi:hypothetical protein
MPTQDDLGEADKDSGTMQSFAEVSVQQVDRPEKVRKATEQKIKRELC